jgi:hypothetical protein
MPDFILRLVLTFVVRQLAKFQQTIKWDLVKADVEKRIRDLIPGDWFDDYAVVVAFIAIDTVADMMDDEAEWTALITLLSQKKFTEALDMLLKWVKTKVEK